MSDPQNLGLGGLGQRMQAMSDPAAEPRLRPYHGAPLPVGQASNGRPTPAYESFEEFRVTPVTPTPVAAPPPAKVSAPFSPSAASSSGTPFSASQAFEPDFPPEKLPETYATWEELSATGNRDPLTPPAASGATASAVSAATPSPTAASDPSDPDAPKSGLQRAIQAIRTAMPLVQRLLPLLDGNFATVISALVAPPQSHHPPPPPPIPVDLGPVERGLAEVRNSNRELRGQVQEQVTTLKRVEDKLERVREATDRNTLEQQELVEDLRSMGSRIMTFLVIGLILLAGSIGLNVFFLVQLQHILR